MNQPSNRRPALRTSALLFGGLVATLLVSVQASAVEPVAASSVSASVLSPGVLSPQASKADRLFRRNKKTGKVQSITGTITESGLAETKITVRGDKESKVDTDEILQIVWGDVPSVFTDGVTYAKRGEWENAVTNFQEAAGSDDARDPVKAVARLRSIEAMIQWGATDPARFADAVTEADKFLNDHAADRNMPLVRSLKARAAWLSGDALTARDGYKALYEAGKAAEAGFSPLLVADAALHAGEAALMTAESSSAREMFDYALSAYGAVPTDDQEMAALAAAGAEVAKLGAAQSKLAKGDFGSAASDFSSAASSAETVAGKGAARLGLGLALIGDGKPREAQLELAWVAGLDHTSPDRRAAAMVGMAQAAMAASPEGAGEAKAILGRVQRDFGTTPAAAKAAELSGSL